jgi:hypothetical protein
MKRILIPGTFGLLAAIALASCGSSSPTQTVVLRDVVYNGSFELPLVDTTNPSTPFHTYTLGTDGPTGWIADNVDLVYRTLWPAANGSQSIDLNAQTSGWIEQVVATQPGGVYELVFAYAANPAQSQLPLLKKFRVVWNGTPVETLQVNATVAIAWNRDTVHLTAKGSDTLKFESLVGGSGGATVDDVSLVGP